jgi:hypothetical protein
VVGFGVGVSAPVLTIVAVPGEDVGEAVTEVVVGVTVATEAPEGDEGVGEAPAAGVTTDRDCSAEADAE